MLIGGCTWRETGRYFGSRSGASPLEPASQGRSNKDRCLGIAPAACFSLPPPSFTTIEKHSKSVCSGAADMQGRGSHAAPQFPATSRRKHEGPELPCRFSEQASSVLGLGALPHPVGASGRSVNSSTRPASPTVSSCDEFAWLRIRLACLTTAQSADSYPLRTRR